MKCEVLNNNIKYMKKAYFLIILAIILIPISVKANIRCIDGTYSPSCKDCHSGCCSHHGGCASNSKITNKPDKTKRSNNAKSNTNNSVKTNDNTKIETSTINDTIETNNIPNRESDNNDYNVLIIGILGTIGYIVFKNKGKKI